MENDSVATQNMNVGNYCFERPEVLAVTKITAFWDMMPYAMVDRSRPAGM
jgi:hypothetical protein